MSPVVRAEPDVLADVLNTLRLKGRVFCASDLTAPWSLEIPAGNLARFHVVEGGGGWIKLQGEDGFTPIGPGDVVILPHGAGHVISSDQQTAPVLLDEALSQDSHSPCIFRHGGDGPESRLVCGSFEFENAAANPLLPLLPPLMLIRGSLVGGGEWLNMTIRLLAHESRNPVQGFETVISRLTDVIFVQAVRSWIQDQPLEQGGWLGALRDRQIGSALGLIHRHPGRVWSVSMLAAEVGMSRSQFAARFTALVGEPPLSYLTRWRMRVAADLIVSDKTTVWRVAEKVGYESEAAFSKAFKRQFGVAPGAYRRASA